MSEIARGWNENDARRAASCFTEDAIYSSVPNPSAHRSRAELYRWFGGDAGRPRPMRMEWHRFIFDPEQQIGVGEYSFRYEIQTHGLVIVKVKDGRVANWREYEQQSNRTWEEILADNEF